MRCGGLIARRGELNSQLMSSGGQVSRAHKVSCTTPQAFSGMQGRKKNAWSIHGIFNHSKSVS